MKHDTLHIATRLAGNVPGLLLEAEKTAHTFMRGAHGRRRAGLGETFWQFRHYQPGDSSRDVDWKQTAKRDDVFVRQLEWEASQTLWLYRDASASMDFKSHANMRTKKDFAEIILMALAIVGLSGGERVGLLGTAMLPQAHEASAGRIAEMLSEQQALSEGVRPVSANSHVVLVGDFYGDSEKLGAFCGALATRGVKGLLLQVCDPAEENLPYGGRIRFIDAADQKSETTIPQVEAVRDEYLRRFAAHRAGIEGIANSCGWRFMHARSDDKPESVLAAAYDLLAAKRKV